MNVTPKTVPATKRLGLSRSLGINPIARTLTTEANVDNPSESPESTIVSSLNAAETISERIPYAGNTENLSIKSNLNETPVSSNPNKSTYKLSLCKSTTEAMTRKRMHSQQKKLLMQPKRLKLELKFDEVQTEESTQDDSHTKSTSDEWGKTSGPNTPLSNSSLQEDIDELKKKITSIEKHQQHTSELEALKLKWLEAGRQVIEELKEKIGQDEEVFLAHFQIDPGLFNLNSSE